MLSVEIWQYNNIHQIIMLTGKINMKFENFSVLVNLQE